MNFNAADLGLHRRRVIGQPSRPITYLRYGSVHLVQVSSYLARNRDKVVAKFYELTLLSKVSPSSYPREWCIMNIDIIITLDIICYTYVVASFLLRAICHYGFGFYMGYPRLP